MNKKLLGLVGFAFVAALAVEVVARPTNSWNFKTLLLQSDQTLSNAGTLTQTGPATFSGATSFTAGTLSPIPAAQTLAAAFQIAADACGGIKQITSAAPVTSSTTTPFPTAAAANAGCDMSIVNVGASSITIKAVALQFFPLNNADVVVGSSSTLTVISNGTYWYQTGGTQNR